MEAAILKKDIDAITQQKTCIETTPQLMAFLFPDQHEVGSRLMGFLILFCLYGWILVFIVAAVFAIGGILSVWFEENFRPKLLILSTLLVFLGFAWQQAMLDYTFGRTIGTIVSESGRRHAKIRKGGARTYTLAIDSTSGPFKIPLTNGLPDNAFWMSDDSAIGVDYGSFKIIIEVDLLIKSTSNALTESELQRLYPKHGLTQARSEEFEKAQQRAKRLGILWAKQ